MTTKINKNSLDGGSVVSSVSRSSFIMEKDDDTIPDYVESLTITKNVTEIRDLLCNGHEQLTSVVIPDSVTSIGERAFHFTSLTSVEMLRVLEGTLFQVALN
jgi:hypothetical protein